jgi:hypothetical protein
MEVRDARSKAAEEARQKDKKEGRQEEETELVLLMLVMALVLPVLPVLLVLVVVLLVLLMLVLVLVVLVLLVDHSWRSGLPNPLWQPTLVSSCPSSSSCCCSPFSAASSYQSVRASPPLQAAVPSPGPLPPLQYWQAQLEPLHTPEPLPSRTTLLPSRSLALHPLHCSMHYRD